MKILVVDDEELMRELLTDFLTDKGNEVVAASNGKEALEKYTYFSPDAIVLDIMMAGMDGFEVCKQIRQGLSDQKTKVFMLTGMGGKDVRERGLQAGATDIFFKPFSMESLYQHILDS